MPGLQNDAQLLKSLTSLSVAGAFLSERRILVRYVLKDRFCLRSWEGVPEALVDVESGAMFPISKREMELLQLCDGTVDLDLPILPESFREMAAAAQRNGVIIPALKGERSAAVQAYHCHPNRYIHTAHWSITGKCNYHCRHCYMSAPEGRYGELPKKTILDIIDQMEECGIWNVSLTGGEPLIRKDFLEIVEVLVERGIRIVSIYSNGRLVTKDLLRALDALGIHPEFNMSYDGEGWHDWLRGMPGAEQAVEEAFRRCHERGFPTGAEMCIHAANAGTLAQSIRNLASWGCASLKTNPIANVGMWQECEHTHELALETLYQIYLEYLCRYYEDGMPLRLQLGGFFMADPETPERYLIPMLKTGEEPEKKCICGHARMVMYISPEGRALPCMALSGMQIQKEFPSIPEEGLRKCLSDSRYLRFIETTGEEYLHANPKCAQCTHAGVCLGGCRAGALEKDSENLMGADPAACALFHGGWIEKIVTRMREICPDVRMEHAIPEQWKEDSRMIHRGNSQERAF